MICRFNYVRGSVTRQVIGRVLNYRDIVNDQPIKPDTRFYNPIHRSQFLFTFKLPDGSIKTYYHSRMKDVEVLGRLARFGLWLAGVRV